MKNLKALPCDTESFNNKSIQRKIFDESEQYHLKGDDDSFNLSLIDCQTSFIQSKRVSSLRSCNEDVKNSEQVSNKSNLEVHEQNSMRSSLGQKHEGNANLVQQARVRDSLSKQKTDEKIQIVTQKKERQVCFKEEEKSSSLESQKSFKSKQVIFKMSDSNKKNESNNIETNNICSVKMMEQSYSTKNIQKISIKQIQESQIVSVNNYLKAAKIISKVIRKSANRVERINQHIKHFITILKTLKQNRRLPQHLEDKQCQLLQDVSYVNQAHEENKLRTLSAALFMNIVQYCKIPLPPLFMPIDTFRIYWDFFQIIFIYSFLYSFSILLFFCSNQQDSKQAQFYFEFAFFLILFDIFVNFNTSYFDKDVIVVKRKKIAWKYISSSVFITDVLCLFIIGWRLIFNKNLVYNQNNDMIIFLINLLLFSKLNGCQEKRNRLYFVFNLTENQKHLIRLCNQLINVFSVAHIASLCWYFIGNYEVQNGYQISWLQKYNLKDENYIEKYAYSMYWAITTMTTVGYGDIAATNYVEAIFILFAMILFSCMFAYSINSIGFILQEIEKSSKELNDNITTIQRKNVNIPLQSRVRHYLQFLSNEQKDRNLQAESNILKRLTKKLRDEITVEINQRILKTYSIFQFNFSEQTLIKLAFIMEEIQISPNEIIFEQGDSQDQSIYLIESGVIEIYQLTPPNCSFILSKLNRNNSFHVFKQLKKKDFFGEISFFSGLARKACARSLNLSTLYKIDRDKFIKILKENSEGFERFKMIEELIKVQKNLNCISLECYICKQQGHIAYDCPTIHQKFDTQFQNLRYNFSIFQNRQKTERRKKKQSPKYVAQKNAEICKKLKKQLRHFNTQAEKYFNNTYVDFQQSQNNIDNQDEDYQTSSDESSEFLDQSQQSSYILDKKDIKFHGDKQKSTIQQKISERQNKNSIFQNHNFQESHFENEIFRFAQSQKSIQNLGSDFNPQKSTIFKEQNPDIENDVKLEEEHQIEMSNDQLNNSFTNIKSSIQVQKSISNARLSSNLNSLEQKQKVKKIEKNGSKQKNNSSKKKLSSEDIYLANLSDEETINPIQSSSSYRKTARGLTKIKEFHDQQSKSTIEMLNFLNGSILKNLVYQISQNSISSYNNMNHLEDSNSHLSHSLNDVNLNSFSPLQNKSNLSQKNFNFNFYQNEQNESNSNSKSMQILNMPASQMISTLSNKYNQQDILQFFEDILKKNGKSYACTAKQSKMLFDEELNCSQISMNNFDRIKIFKRFFPHNNFNHVFCKKISEHNKDSKGHITKGRRNNILVSSFIPRRSMFFNDQLNIINYPSEINSDSYKPTFLSYGIYSKYVSRYPKIFHNHRIFQQNNK